MIATIRFFGDCTPCRARQAASETNSASLKVTARGVSDDIMTKQKKPLLFPSVPNAPAYLRRMPTKAEVPAGMVVVHNNVRPPRIGSRGFRAWLAHPAAGYVRCDCKWAVHLPVHYVEREGL